MMIMFLNGYGQLSGTYTVGGSSPYFPNMDSAFNYMERKGVTGKVRLNVRSGTRTLSRTISTIPGASATNTIQVAPDPSNTSPVVFTNRNTASKYFILCLKQNFLRFDSLTFRVDSSYAYGNAIVFAANCDYTAFNACVFYGKDTISASSRFAMIFYNNNFNVNYMKVTNCEFFNGSMAILLGSGRNCEILNNRIINYYYSACFFTNQDYIIYEGNYSIDNNRYQFTYGVYFDFCDYSVIDNNKIYVGGWAGMGLSYSHSVSSSTNLTKIYNNFISGFDSTKSGKFYGIFVGACTYVGVYFNTFATFNNSRDSRAAYLYQESTNSGNSFFYNNIYYARVGYALYYADIYKIKSDYNLIYSKGSIPIALYYGNDVKDLATLQRNSVLDSHSIAKNLVFKDPMELHTFTLDLYKKGIPVSGINKDIDGYTRKSPKPDIGANEERLPTLDLALNSIVNNLCWGNSDISVKIRNMGFTKIDSCKILWQVSINGGAFGTQNISRYSGALLTGSDTTVKLGSYNFVKGNDYKLRILLNAPNNKKDSFSSNDSLNQFIPVGVKGTYTIGGTSPDFTSIDKAFSMLEKNGLCGPVRLLLRQGDYNEQINIGPIAGISSINTVKLVSDPKNTTVPKVFYNVTSTDNWVFKFQNTSYISVDSINILSVGNAFGRVIVFSGINSYLSFNNDSITGIPVKGNSFDHAVIFDEISTGNVNKNLLISNCMIRNGSYGIYLNGNSASNKVSGIVIKDNKISDFSYQGISSNYHQNVKILNNNINDNNTNNSPTGIAVSLDYSCDISGNLIAIGGLVSPQGIYCNLTNGSDTSPVLISNNIVSLYNKSASGSTNGIFAQEGTFNRIVNNTVVLLGGDSTSKALNAAYFSTGNADIYNNCFANYSKGYAGYFQAATGLIKNNNNNYFAKGLLLAYYNINCPLLKDLQNASGNESAALGIDPCLSGLKMRSKILKFNARALRLKYVKTDFDGNVRDTATPDIGALEFTPYTNDLALQELLINAIPKDCGVDSAKIFAVIRNNSSLTKTKIKIRTNVKGSNSQLYNWIDSFNRTLAPGVLDTFQIVFRTTDGGSFNISSSIVGPDDDSFNDSAAIATGNISGTPDKPKSHSDTICDNIIHNITTDFPANAMLKWYSKQNGGNLVAQSDTLNIQNLKKDSTLFVSAAYQYKMRGLLNASGMGGGTNCNTGGLMFHLKPHAQMNLDSISSHFKTAGPQSVLIYLKKGTFAGSETNPSVWKFIDTVKLNSPAAGIFATLKLPHPVRLEKDSLYSIYLNYDVAYTYTTLYDTFNSKELSISGSSGLCGSFGSVNPYHVFVGKIYYSTFKYCESERVSYTLKTKNAPVINIGKDTAYCANFGMNLLLDPGPGFTHYQWSGGDTTPTIYVKDSGKYKVEVTSQNLCKAHDELIVTKYINPTISLGKDMYFCSTQTINFILNPGSVVYKSYLWSNGIKLKNIKVTSPGVYSLIVTDDKGCNGWDTVQIIKVNYPVVNLGNDTFYCSHDGLKLLLDAGKGYKNYTWSNLDTLQKSLITASGKYFVVVEDYFGCKGKDSIIITEKISPLVKLGNDTTYCRNNGINLKLDAGSGFKDYQWSTSDKGSNININTGGIYSVQVKGMNGCMAADTLIVFEDFPEVNLGNDTGYCTGGSISLTLDAGSKVKAYMWSTSATTRSIKIQSKGLFYVAVTDSLGCIGGDTLKISEVSVKPKLGNDTAYCENSGFDKLLDAGAGYLSYQWLSGEKTQAIRIKGQGNYSVVATAQFGCIGADTFNVTELLNPVVDIGTDRILNPYLPVNENLDAGAGFKKYLWNTSETSQKITVSATGYYSVIATGNNGCDAKDTVRVRFWNASDISSVAINEVKVYPNPAIDFLSIVSDSYNLEKVRIFNETGKMVYQFNQCQKSVLIDVSEWSGGVYLIRYTINGIDSHMKCTIIH